MGLVLFSFQIWNAATIIRQYSNYEWIQIFFVAVGLILLAYGLQIFAWTQLMASCGYPIKMRPAIRGYIVSFIPRYIPGTVWGYWSRNEWLLNEFQIPYSTSSLGSILEIITGIITAGITSVFILDQYLNVEATYLLIGALIFISCSSLFVLKLRYKRTIELHVFRLSIAVITYFIFWITYGISLFWFLTRLTSVRIDLLSAISMYALAWLVGFLFIITPSGLGIRELVLSVLLFKQFSLSTSGASLIALSIRFAIYLAEILLLIVWIDKTTMINMLKRRLFYITNK